MSATSPSSKPFTDVDWDGFDEVYSNEPELRRPGRLLGAMICDLWKGRELAWRLFVRDFSSKYRQTALGYVWAFLPAIATSLAFILLQSGGVISVGELGVPYAAYVMIGTLLWQVFADAMQSPLATVLASKAVLVKINLPREAILLSGLYLVAFNFLIRLVLLAAVFAWFRILPPPQALLLPLGALSLAVFGFMIGLLLTPLGILYQDVTQSLPILTSIWLLLTPVAYPPTSEGLLGRISSHNPVTPLLGTSRDWLLEGRAADLGGFLWVFGIALALLFVGWVVFRIATPHLIARMGG